MAPRRDHERKDYIVAVEAAEARRHRLTAQIEAMRNVRSELSAHHRLQNTLDERLGRLEQHLPSQPTPAGPRRPRAETAEPSDRADRLR